MVGGQHRLAGLPSRASPQRPAESSFNLSGRGEGRAGLHPGDAGPSRRTQPTPPVRTLPGPRPAGPTRRSVLWGAANRFDPHTLEGQKHLYRVGAAEPSALRPWDEFAHRPTPFTRPHSVFGSSRFQPCIRGFEEPMRGRAVGAHGRGRVRPASTAARDHHRQRPLAPSRLRIGETPWQLNRVGDPRARRATGRTTSTTGGSPST